MRDTLLAEDVKAAAVDYDAGLAYLIPNEGYTAEKAIAAIAKTDKFKATRQP